MIPKTLQDFFEMSARKDAVYVMKAYNEAQDGSYVDVVFGKIRKFLKDKPLEHVIKFSNGSYIVVYRTTKNTKALNRLLSLGYEIVHVAP